MHPRMGSRFHGSETVDKQNAPQRHRSIFSCTEQTSPDTGRHEHRRLRPKLEWEENTPIVVNTVTDDSTGMLMDARSTSTWSTLLTLVPSFSSTQVRGGSGRADTVASGRRCLGHRGSMEGRLRRFWSRHTKQRPQLGRVEAGGRRSV
jgi:hypothetical protein